VVMALAITQHGGTSGRRHLALLVDGLKPTGVPLPRA
jgi:hypothetical protein